MKRTWIIALFAFIAVVGSFAQTKKEAKDGARQQLVDPPVATASAPAMSAHPSPYNFAGVPYPRIEADNRVTFHFTAPNAQKVQVSIVNAPFDMVKGPDGVWTYTSAPQPPGYHNYWMIVEPFDSPDVFIFIMDKRCAATAPLPLAIRAASPAAEAVLQGQ